MLLLLLSLLLSHLNFFMSCVKRWMNGLVPALFNKNWVMFFLHSQILICSRNGKVYSFDMVRIDAQLFWFIPFMLSFHLIETTFLVHQVIVCRWWLFFLHIKTITGTCFSCLGLSCPINLFASFQFILKPMKLVNVLLLGKLSKYTFKI